MMKQSRIEEDITGEIEASDFKERISEDFFKKNEYNCIICGDLPAETKIYELRKFLDKFGQIQYFWLEDENGEGNRQALIFFQTQEEMENAVKLQSQYFNSSFISVGRCNQELIEMSQKFLLLHFEKDQELQKQRAQQYQEQGIVKDIITLLIRINQNEIEGRIQQGRFLTLPANFHLATKFACDILSEVILFSTFTVLHTQKISILKELINLLKSVPIHYVNHQHTQFLKEITNDANKEMIINISQYETLQSLANLLEHTNTKVKNDSITIMKNILLSDEIRNQKRKPHQFYSDSKRDGVIFQVYQNCFIHFDSYEMKNCAAIVLGVLLRTQELDQNMKQSLIYHLNTMIFDVNNAQQVANALDMLCGLALQTANISEIAKDGFIETILKLIQSNNVDIRSYSLELLLILIDIGGDQLQNLIKKSMNIFKFLELIGDSNQQFDDKILKIIIKYSKNVQVLNIQKLFDMQQRFTNSDEEQQKQIFINELIPTILLYFSHENERISEQKENEEKISSLQLGIINSCCTSLTQISNKNSEYKNDIINTGILTQLQKLLHNIPYNQIKSIHFKPLEKLTDQETYDRNQYLFKLGTVQDLTKFLNHTSQNIVLLSAQIIINIITNGIYFYSSQRDCYIAIPFFLQIPYQEILKSDGTLDLLEQSIYYHENQEDVLKLIIQTIIYIYRRHSFPIQLLNLVIPQIKSEIMGKFEKDLDIQEEIDKLQQLSYHQSNHEVIIQSRIINFFSDNINQFYLDDQIRIIDLIRILYKNANSQTRQQIKINFPVEQINSIIKRNDFVHLFFAYDAQQQKQQKAIDNQKLYNACCQLFAYIKEEDKMNQLNQLSNKIEQQISIENKIKNSNEKRELLEKQEIKNEQNIEIIIRESDNQEWEIIQKIISIVKEIKDKELVIGASYYVRDSIYSILFEKIRNNDVEEIIQSLECFQQLINNNDDAIFYNFIDDYFFGKLDFIIKEQTYQEQFTLLEKALSLLSSVAERGALMGRDLENNHFYYIIQNKHIKPLIQLIEEQPNTEENVEIKQLKENIRLKAAICLCCFYKNVKMEQNLRNSCQIIFNKYLSNFTQKLQQQSTSNQNEINIDTCEINIIHKVLTSLFCLSQNSEYTQTMITQNKVHEMIFPLIHLNCKCMFEYSISNSSSSTNYIVSAAFHLLSNLIYEMDSQTIEKFNSMHNILGHLIPFIYSNIDPNNKIKKSFSDQQDTQQSFQFVQQSSYKLNAALSLLLELSNNSHQIMHQIMIEPYLLKQILQQIQYIKTNHFKSEQHSQTLFRTFSLIESIIIEASIKEIDWIVNKMNILQIVSNLMNSAGGQGSDDDEVLCTDIYIHSKLIKILDEQKEDQKTMKILNEIKIWIEENGIVEEDDALIFHTDTRRIVGVQIYAQKLLNNLI